VLSKIPFCVTVNFPDLIWFRCAELVPVPLIVQIFVFSRVKGTSLYFLGVVLALKVPQLALRKQNLCSAIQSLTTIASLHQTQPTIQVQFYMYSNEVSADKTTSTGTS
jgi:hypothetical protein